MTIRAAYMTLSLTITFVTPSGTGSNTLRWSSLGIWECRGSSRYLLLIPGRTEKRQHQKENKASNIHSGLMYVLLSVNWYSVRYSRMCKICKVLLNVFVFTIYLIAQLVEHCTGIAEVMGSNPVQAWFVFSGLKVLNCLRARSFGSYSHSGIPGFPFRLFCSQEQNSRNIFRNIFLFRNIPNERDFNSLSTGVDIPSWWTLVFD